MKLTVNVTQEDIHQAEKDVLIHHLCRTHHCPLALALRRVTGRGWSVLTFTSLAPVLLTVRGCFVIAPLKVADFVRAFDHGYPSSQPFEFTVEVPDNIFTPPPLAA